MHRIDKRGDISPFCFGARKSVLLFPSIPIARQCTVPLSRARGLCWLPFLACAMRLFPASLGTFHDAVHIPFYVLR